MTRGRDSHVLVRKDHDQRFGRLLGVCYLHYGAVYLQRAPLIVNNYKTWDKAMRSGRVGGMRAGLGVPLMRHGTCLGVLLLRVYTDDQTRPFDEDDARLATLFGDQVAAALLAAEAFEQQRQVALHDGLTGLPNRTLLADGCNRRSWRRRAKTHH